MKLPSEHLWAKALKMADDSVSGISVFLGGRS